MNEVRIVIATSGWVFVGNYFRDEHHVRLTNASSIRVWGTTAGLGEIALAGPTKSTVLDKAGIVDIPVSSVIATLECAGAKWVKHV